MKIHNIFGHILRKIVKTFSLDGSRFQIFWEQILRLCYFAMNYQNDLAGFVNSSGEIFVLKYVYKTQREEAIIFDIGANTGDYTLAVLKEFKNNVKVFCFEPSQVAFNQLKEIIRDKNVNLINCAIGNYEGKGNLYTDCLGGWGSSLYKRSRFHENLKVNFTEEIRVQRLDNFLKEFNISHITLLKIDAEGAEYEIINSIKHLFDKIDFIQFEINNSAIDAHIFFKDFYYLLSDNYRIYRILRKGLYEINKYSEVYEVFNTANYLAVNKSVVLRADSDTIGRNEEGKDENS